MLNLNAESLLCCVLIRHYINEMFQYSNGIFERFNAFAQGKVIHLDVKFYSLLLIACNFNKLIC